MNKPFIFLFISFASGIFFSEHIIVGITFIVIIFLLYIFILKKNRELIYFILFFCFGYFYGGFKLNYFPENHIKKLNYINKANFIIHITEKVEETEDKIYFNGHIISIEDKAEKISDIKGKIRVTVVKDFGIKVKYGDILKINGVLQEPFKPKSKEDFNYKKFLNYKSIYYTLHVKEKDIEIIGRRIPNCFYYFSYKLKEKLINIIYSTLPVEEGKVLEGIMLGNYRVLPEEINDYFKRTGTAHILAVSGMNVGLIALFVFMILKLLNFSTKLRAIVTLFFITIFAIITGADPSIIRATFMAYVILLGYVIEYDSDLLNSLAVAGFFILLINPFELFSVSFQLSFFATFGIIYYSGYISKIIPNLPKWLSEIIFTTWTSQIFIIPIMANTFHQISLISFLANFFIVPISSIITILGFVLWIIGLVSMNLAIFFGATIWLLIKIMVLIVKILSSIPFAAISVKSMNIIFLFLYYLFFIILPHNDIDIYINKISFKKTLLFILFIMSFFYFYIPKKDCYIYFPEIKNIGAMIIKTENNKKILLLGCDRGKNLKEIKNKIILFLKKQGINILDYLILFSVKEKNNYEIIRNNFFVRNILSDRDMDNSNSNFYIDKDVYVFFNGYYVELDIKDNTFIFSKYLNDELLNSKKRIIFSCCIDIKQLNTKQLKNFLIIINSSMNQTYYKIKLPPYIWDVNKNGGKSFYF